MQRWSPDGTLIAYRQIGGPIKLISRDGGASRELTGPGPETLFSIWYEWPPGSADIFYHTILPGGEHAFWRVASAGGVPRLIARFHGIERRTRRSEFATDGQRLFFTVMDDEADVWMMELGQPGAGR
ncbi:MAG: hypothetical protein WKG32_05910 [Gemmatimonadaceae bacterium]